MSPEESEHTSGTGGECHFDRGDSTVSAAAWRCEGVWSFGGTVGGLL